MLHSDLSMSWDAQLPGHLLAVCIFQELRRTMLTILVPILILLLRAPQRRGCILRC